MPSNSGGQRLEFYPTYFTQFKPLWMHSRKNKVENNIDFSLYTI